MWPLPANAFMDLFARCGNISCAIQLFDGFLIKNSISWSIMIFSAYGLHGDGEAALGLLSQMRLSGLKPDNITYVSILSACSHTGLVEQWPEGSQLYGRTWNIAKDGALCLHCRPSW
ncbi:hypothetical protein RJ640_030442 [Escallonia rubra]|uniref:Pentatricopeptide repeat-containing protein n=1 Tax=Escallonia rubra TaxID=112253 RepID=A0AA88QT65_9ASTE|nr:hypothetical protein RJ640_030442 [Escallonia rubra]